MQMVSNVFFENETVCMDNKHFAHCVLSGCVLEYSGHDLTIESTSFTGCRLNLIADAGRTLQFLQCMGYMKDLASDAEPLAALVH